MVKKLIKWGINGHIISKDVQKSKVTHMDFLKRVDEIESTMNSIESRNQDNLGDQIQISKKIDNRVNDTITKIFELRADMKNLINHNTDKIAQVKIQLRDLDKVNDLTNLRIEELIQQIKTNYLDSRERDDAVERRITSKHDNFKDLAEQRFNKLQRGNFDRLIICI
jgi:hypothetical protein